MSKSSPITREVAIMASYVGDARPVGYFQHRCPKDYADNGSITAGY